MPIICDPGQTFKVVLDGDKNKSPQPAFIIRTLTMRQWREAARLHDATFGGDNKDPDDVADRLLVALKPLLAGWENVPGCDAKNDLDKLQDAMTIHEMFELLDKAWQGQKPTVNDLKNSGSPSGLATAGPAATAPV